MCRSIPKCVSWRCSVRSAEECSEKWNRNHWRWSRLKKQKSRSEWVVIGETMNEISSHPFSYAFFASAFLLLFSLFLAYFSPSLGWWANASCTMDFLRFVVLQRIIEEQRKSHKKITSIMNEYENHEKDTFSKGRFGRNDGKWRA